jgi:hypothetical protein
MLRTEDQIRSNISIFVKQVTAGNKACAEVSWSAQRTVFRKQLEEV